MLTKTHVMESILVGMHKKLEKAIFLVGFFTFFPASRYVR